MHDGTPSIHGRWRTADPTLDPATAPTPTKTPGDSHDPGDNIGPNGDVENLRGGSAQVSRVARRGPGRLRKGPARGSRGLGRPGRDP